MSTANNKQIIIAAIASRPYVAAAVEAGYTVVAIDAFSDCDVRQLAASCYQLAVHEGQLDSAQLLAILDDLDLSQYAGFCYGAGFEQATGLLAQVQKRVPVFGNAESVIQQCKSPKHFFTLCDALSIPYPMVSYTKPTVPQGWLVKAIGASGGAHIQRLSTANSAANHAHVYYQKAQSGMAVSCLFLSHQQGVQIIGFNEQWSDGDERAPFRYTGAVSQPVLSALATSRLTTYVEKLSASVGLIGINSCDVICDGDDVYVLEINPRLSATMDLYPQAPLMQMHINACQHKAQVETNIQVKGSSAHQVLYAKQPFVLKKQFDWPDWARDVPTVGTTFETGMPICTVLANEATALLAKQLVGKRALTLSDTLLN